MLKPTPANLKKVESLFQQLGYTLRYEKGHFQSGYCLVENKKIVVINKFFDSEGRMNVLLDLLSRIPVDRTVFDGESAAFFEKLFPQAESTAPPIGLFDA
jgi:hypothetical protein